MSATPSVRSLAPRKRKLLELQTSNKILKGKAYTSIGHLQGSRLGDADKLISPGQAKLLTKRTRDRHDRVVVTEKLDGSCVAVYRAPWERCDEIHPIDFVTDVEGWSTDLVALGRAGHTVRSSPRDFIRNFEHWVTWYADVISDILKPGEHMAGEWLTLAHGLKYDLPHGPFVALDIMNGYDRLPYLEMRDRVGGRLPVAELVHYGGPVKFEKFADTYASAHGAHGKKPEGYVYRMERKGEVEFMAKWVRPDFVPGRYFKHPVWNSFDDERDWKLEVKETN